jgi:hypothetical protein
MFDVRPQTLTNERFSAGTRRESLLLLANPPVAGRMQLLGFHQKTSPINLHNCQTHTLVSELGAWQSEVASASCA